MLKFARRHADTKEMRQKRNDMKMHAPTVSELPCVSSTAKSAKHESSIFASLQEDISTSFGRNNNMVNRSLNVSFVSLGQLDLNSTLAALPEWFADVHRKRNMGPSQIKAKVEYKATVKPDNERATAVSVDSKLMPPPLATSYEKKIRIQDTAERCHKIQNWYLGFSANGAAVIQGYDTQKGKNIKSTDIVAVKNLREILTTRSTYVLVGNLDRRKWIKQLPIQSERYFKDGFPDDWKVVVKMIKTQLEAANQADTESDAENDQGNFYEIPNVSESTRRMAIKQSKLQVDAFQPNLAINKVDQSKSDEKVQIIRLENWTIILSGRGKHAQFKLADTMANVSGHIESKFEISLDQIVMKSSLCFVSKDKPIEYHLIGFGIFDENTPEFVRHEFADGFPQHYELFLEKWRDYDMSKFSESSATRSGRFPKPTEKKTALINQTPREQIVRKKVPNNIANLKLTKHNQMSSASSGRDQMPLSSNDLSSSDEDMTKATGNTKKAAKVRAEIKERLKESATYADDDFFFHADAESPPEDDLHVILQTPVQKVKARTKVMSPMAAFLASQHEELQESESDQEEQEEEVKRDKRKDKAIEKFVYHEKTERLKRKEPQKNVASKIRKLTSKSRNIQFMEQFLQREFERKKKIDQKFIYGEDSDALENSD
ncbi:Hypothetical predicted protein [Cloeon dipterum]|uniref:SANTA domain-containing protein n=1 Tax=Cloeon dipterum TaxID=197152 RepID=A0A8S1C8L5_9INSE|nr:Hypothetical predicted protein [Cloeon dipterum]